MEGIRGGVARQFDLINPKKQAKKKGYKNSGELLIKHAEIRVEHSFLDYIRGG